MPRPQCKGITKKSGNRCKLPAVLNSDYCHLHQRHTNQAQATQAGQSVTSQPGAANRWIPIQSFIRRPVVILVVFWAVIWGFWLFSMHYWSYNRAPHLTTLGFLILLLSLSFIGRSRQDVATDLKRLIILATATFFATMLVFYLAAILNPNFLHVGAWATINTTLTVWQGFIGVVLFYCMQAWIRDLYDNLPEMNFADLPRSIVGLSLSTLALAIFLGSLGMWADYVTSILSPTQIEMPTAIYTLTPTLAPTETNLPTNTPISITTETRQPAATDTTTKAFARTSTPAGSMATTAHTTPPKPTPTAAPPPTKKPSSDGPQLELIVSNLAGLLAMLCLGSPPKRRRRITA